MEPVTGNKFYFQQRRGRLDLRRLSSLDLEKIVKDVDIDVLQMHLENITFCQLREEDLRYLTDPLVVKLFRTAQLMIEYLLYAQEQLAANLHTLAKKYAEKKRSLVAKRRELSELKESTKQLKSQVQSKRKNIATLEDLLKNAGKIESRNNRRHNKKESIAISSQLQPQPNIAHTNYIPPIIKFYVTGPDGLCIEFNERGDTMILEIIKHIDYSFDLKAIRDEVSEQETGQIKLIYQGRILLEAATIDDCNIRPGDTIVAVFKNHSDSRDLMHTRQERSLPVVQPANPNVVAELSQFMSVQQDTVKEIAVEMRRGWEQSLQAMTLSSQTAQSRGQDDNQLAAKIDEKLSKFEDRMRQQLDAQLKYYDERLQDSVLANLGPRSSTQTTSAGAALRSKGRANGLYVGDIESDTDEALLSNEEISQTINASQQKLSKLETDVRGTGSVVKELRDAMAKQSSEIELLRQQLATQQRAPPETPQLAASATPSPRVVAASPSPAPAESSAPAPAPLAKPPANYIKATSQLASQPVRGSKWSKFTGEDLIGGGGGGGGIHKESRIDGGLAGAEVAAAGGPSIGDHGAAAAAVISFPADPAAAKFSPAPVTTSIAVSATRGVDSNYSTSSSARQLAAAAATPAPLHLPLTADKKRDMPSPLPSPQRKQEKSSTSSSAGGGVIVRFSLGLNPDLAMMMDEGGHFAAALAEVQGVEVKVAPDIIVDDLIFELRRTVAEKLNIPLSRVSLRIQGLVANIRLGLDLEGPLAGSLSAKTAAGMAAAGTLTVAIAQGVPMTDAQIDELVAQWENHLSDAASDDMKEPALDPRASTSSSLDKQAMSVSTSLNSAGFERLGNMYVRGDTVLVGKVGFQQDGSKPKGGTGGSSSKSRSGASSRGGAGGDGSPRSPRSPSAGRSAKIKGMSLPQRRSWDGNTVEEMDEQIDSLYDELDGVLSGLSESDGLTDEEFKQKMSKLKKSTERLPKPITEHISSYRGTIAGALAAAVDSDAEGFSAGEEGTRGEVSLSLRGRDSSGKLPGQAATFSSVASSSGLLRLSLTGSRRSYDDGKGFDFDDGPLLASRDSVNLSNTSSGGGGGSFGASSGKPLARPLAGYDPQRAALAAAAERITASPRGLPGGTAGAGAIGGAGFGSGIGPGQLQAGSRPGSRAPSDDGLDDSFQIHGMVKGLNAMESMDSMLLVKTQQQLQQQRHGGGPESYADPRAAAALGHIPAGASIAHSLDSTGSRVLTESTFSAGGLGAGIGGMDLSYSRSPSMLAGGGKQGRYSTGFAAGDDDGDGDENNTVASSMGFKPEAKGASGKGAKGEKGGGRPQSESKQGPAGVTKGNASAGSTPVRAESKNAAENKPAQSKRGSATAGSGGGMGSGLAAGQASNAVPATAGASGGIVGGGGGGGGGSMTGGTGPPPRARRSFDSADIQSSDIFDALGSTGFSSTAGDGFGSTGMSDLTMGDLDLNRTIDSDGGGVGFAPAVKMSEVMRRADEYERVAALAQAHEAEAAAFASSHHRQQHSAATAGKGGGAATGQLGSSNAPSTPDNRQRGSVGQQGSALSKASTASPFDRLGATEGDDNSLAFSDSNEHDFELSRSLESK